MWKPFALPLTAVAIAAAVIAGAPRAGADGSTLDAKPHVFYDRLFRIGALPLSLVRAELLGEAPRLTH
jgi:hypothetical protein